MPESLEFIPCPLCTIARPQPVDHAGEHRTVATANGPARFSDEHVAEMLPHVARIMRKTTSADVRRAAHLAALRHMNATPMRYSDALDSAMQDPEIHAAETAAERTVTVEITADASQALSALEAARFTVAAVTSDELGPHFVLTDRHYPEGSARRLRTFVTRQGAADEVADIQAWERNGR